MNKNRVTVSVGYTRNMGDFESLRYDVSLASDTMEGETTPQAFMRVSTFVEDKLMEQIKETENEIREARGK